MLLGFSKRNNKTLINSILGESSTSSIDYDQIEIGVKLSHRFVGLLSSHRPWINQI